VAAADRNVALPRARALAARWLRPPTEAATAQPVTGLDWLLAGLIAVAVAVLYVHYAFRVGNFQLDELHYVVLARYITTHFPSALWTIPGYGWIDGIGQRLDVYLLAIPMAFFRDPAAFQLDHVIQCAMFAGTALPVFLLARRAGLGRPAAALGCVLAAVVPWATTATSFLAEPTSYPAYAWVLYTTWRTLRAPSAGRDAIVIVALLAAIVARTELLALIVVPPLAVVWHEWSWELRDEARGRRARLLARRLWSGHRLLCAVYGAALLVLIAGRLGLLSAVGLSGLTGHYGLPSLPPLSVQLTYYRYDLSRLIVGTGILTVVLGLPWTVATLVRARDGGRHALAVVCTVGFVAILVGLISIAPNGDERYLMYPAVVLAVTAAAALHDWSMAPRITLRAAGAVLASTFLVVALFASVAWPPLTSAYDWFTYPAATFYQRVLLNHARDLHLSFLAESTIVYAGVVVAAAIFVALARRQGWMRPAAALIAAGLVALCTTETIYNLHKYVNSAAGGGPSASARAFVDEAVPGGATVGAMALTLGATGEYFPIWNAVEFWNASIEWDLFLSPPVYLPIEPGTNGDYISGIASPSGRLDGWPTSPSAPHYLLIPAQGSNSIGFIGRVVTTSSWLSLEIVKLSLPARAAWSIAGPDVNGNLTSGQPATATVYSSALAGLGQRCASFSLITPSGFSGRWPYKVHDGHRTYRGWLRAGKQTAITVPLSVLRAGANATDTLEVTVTGHETVTSPGSAQLVFFNVGGCESDRLAVRTSPWPSTSG
jgi:hypothetical protein